MTSHDTSPPGTRLLAPRTVPLGGVRSMTVRRTLPHRDVRTVGAWCFLDQFGPSSSPMRVLPHPHTGLQTVTWPMGGRVRHRDSLGNDVVVRPGELNLMTAGSGVSHSEFSAADTSTLHGLQLWIALPEHVRAAPAGFQQVTDLPVVTTDAMAATVLVGDLVGHRSAARVHSPLLGADITVHPGRRQVLELDPTFEHAVLLITGDLRVDDEPVPPAHLRYQRPGRAQLSVHSDSGARFVLLGGAPFEENLVMWWNFIGRTHEDIVEARADWESHHDRFGDVDGHGPSRIPAPPMPRARLRPRSGRATH